MVRQAFDGAGVALYLNRRVRPFTLINLEAVALDDAPDLLDILIIEIFSGAKTAGEKARLQ